MQAISNIELLNKIQQAIREALGENVSENQKDCLEASILNLEVIKQRLIIEENKHFINYFQNLKHYQA